LLDIQPGMSSLNDGAETECRGHGGNDCLLDLSTKFMERSKKVFEASRHRHVRPASLARHLSGWNPAELFLTSMDCAICSQNFVERRIVKC
jgi:hypothetical protein